MLLEGKVAWITGASSGIGRELALALSQRGVCVALSARRPEVLREVQQSCDRPDAHLVLPLDVTNEDSLPLAAQQVYDRYSQVDFLMNMAGITQRGRAMDTMIEVDRRIMELNFFGTVALTKTVLPKMVQRGAGHIVVCSSLLGKFGAATRSGYAASKHALHGFFDSLRAEIHGSGVLVTIVCPGFTRTNASINALTPDGTPFGKLDQNIGDGMQPDISAQRIIGSVLRGKSEVYIAGKERMAVYLKRFAPGIFERVIRRVALK